MKLPMRLLLATAAFFFIIVYLIANKHSKTQSIQDKTITQDKSLSFRKSPQNELTQNVLLQEIQTTTRANIYQTLEQFQKEHKKLPTILKARADIFSQDVLDYVDVNYKYEFKMFPNTTREVPRRRAPINVVIIPHSHVDPGWLQTIDEYYKYLVHGILTNTVLALTENPELKFMWAETVFLAKWWDNLTISDVDGVIKMKFQELLRQGRFEIVMGSWVMPDEASTHFYSIIDQMVEGHQWLEHTLGIKPNYTWSIDPFGHSSSFPYFLKSAGFKAMGIGRVHAAVKRHLALNQSLEFHWRQAWDHSRQNDIFCHMLAGETYITRDSCGTNSMKCSQFDFTGHDGERITKDNVATQADILYRQYLSKADLFHTNTIFNLMGHDFKYSTIRSHTYMLENVRQLMRYMNHNRTMNINIKFGTLGDYFKMVQNDTNYMKIPSLIGDFYPYMMTKAYTSKDYWTGYFTTRPFDKYLGRELQWMLRVSEILNTFAALKIHQEALSPYNDIIMENLLNLTEAHRELGVYQHHDAITGTEKKHVAIDYERRMMTGLQACYKVIKTAFNILQEATMTSGEDTIDIDQNEDNNLYIDDVRDLTDMQPSKILIDVTKEQQIIVINPVEHHITTVARFYINDPHVKIFNTSGTEMNVQVNPIWQDMDGMFEDRYELVIEVTVTAFGSSTYRIKHHEETAKCSEVLIHGSKNYSSNDYFKIQNQGNTDIQISNSYLKATFSFDTGDLVSVQQGEDIYKIQASFTSYHSGLGGAYVFKPREEAWDPKQAFTIQNATVRIIHGHIVSEVHTLYAGLTRVFIIHHTGVHIQKAISINNVIDIKNFPVPFRKNIEVMMEIKTNIINKNRIFYSDANGFQMRPRKTNPDIPVNGNFYPMTSMFYLESTKTRLTVTSAQPLGVSNLNPGEVQIGLDRMTMFNDNKGMSEAIDDNKVTSSRFMLFVEKRRKPADVATVSMPSALGHLLQNLINNPLVQMYGGNKNSMYENLALISEELPCNIKIALFRGLFDKTSKLPRLNSIGLTIHSIVYDAHLNITMCKYSKTYNIDKIFNISSKVSQTEESSLSFMHRVKLINISDDLPVSPMELKSYKLDLA
ncbi:unnamed protein product [Owenia fusiformis]|uniref:Alpha-mannosidase n=1 Tax=Owenia fusiformis TaxID=6347 RepID=A0A8J1XGS7_OWEFU|nr:unnamed protein product [Owenia fusiformis]